jgi:hypothetical protein
MQCGEFSFQILNKERLMKRYERKARKKREREREEREKKGKGEI